MDNMTDMYRRPNRWITTPTKEMESIVDKMVSNEAMLLIMEVDPRSYAEHLESDWK